LLIAPLLSAGVTVGNLQQANANGADFDLDVFGDCGPFAPSTFDLQVQAFNTGNVVLTLTYTIVVSNMGVVIFSDLFQGDPILPGSVENTFVTIPELEDPGLYHVDVTAADPSPDIERTASTACELVLPPPPPSVQKIEGLIADVDALDLNNGIKNALTKKLVNAINNITNEDPTDNAEACEKLQSFIDQLNAMVKSGKLTQGQVDPLIDVATQCIWDLCLDT
jgi:hypothetical protein